MVWQRGIKLVVAVYELTRAFPREELFGQARNSSKEFRHFVAIAQGSLAELEMQLELFVHLGYMSREKLGPTWNECKEVGRMLSGLERSLIPRGVA